MVVVFVIVIIVYQLQVVDDDYLNIVLYFQVLVFGVQFKVVDIWCIIDEDWGVGYFFNGGM